MSQTKKPADAIVASGGQIAQFPKVRRVRKSVRVAMMAASDEINLMVVPKNGTNTYHNYKFVSIDDLYRDIVPVIRKHGITWTVRLLNKQLIGDNVEFDVEVDLHWKDGTSYASYDSFFMVHPFIGAQTTGSAKSYASKAFMREEFKIATGEPDADELRQSGRQGARDFMRGVREHQDRNYERPAPTASLPPATQRSPGSAVPGDGREEPPPPNGPGDYGQRRAPRRPAEPDLREPLNLAVAEMRDRKDEALAEAEARAQSERIASEIAPYKGPAPLSLAERNRFETDVGLMIDRMKDDMSVRRVWHSRSHIIARWEQDDPDRYRRVLAKFTAASAKFGRAPPQDRAKPKFHRPPGQQDAPAPTPRTSNVVSLHPGKQPAKAEPAPRLRRIDKEPEGT